MGGVTREWAVGNTWCTLEASAGILRASYTADMIHSRYDARCIVYYLPVDRIVTKAGTPMLCTIGRWSSMMCRSVCMCVCVSVSGCVRISARARE